MRGPAVSNQPQNFLHPVDTFHWTVLFLHSRGAVAPFGEQEAESGFLGGGVIIEAIPHQHTGMEAVILDQGHQAIGLGALGGILAVDVVDTRIELSLIHI